MYTYNAKVTSVYDGDTITLEVDLGFSFKFTNSYRLLRINCPELRGETRVAGLQSRDRLRELVLGKNVIVRTKKDSTEKYGRYLADIDLLIGSQVVNINDLLVTEGLAVYIEY